MEARSRTRLWVTGLVFGASAIAVSPAFASISSPDGGALVWQGNSGTVLSVEDTKSDGNSVKGQWNNTGNELKNTSGYGTVVKKYNLTITAIRACTVKGQFRPDVCSGWGS